MEEGTDDVKTIHEWVRVEKNTRCLKNSIGPENCKKMPDSTRQKRKIKKINTFKL